MVERDEGRRAARHRGGQRRLAVPLSRRRKDGHDQRRHGRLVHRLHVGSRRRRVDGLRQAAEDQGERAGRRSRRAGVDGVHERGLQAQAGAAGLAACPPGSSREIDRRHDEHARRTRTVRGTCRQRSSSSPAPIRSAVCTVQLRRSDTRRLSHDTARTPDAAANARTVESVADTVVVPGRGLRAASRSASAARLARPRLDIFVPRAAPATPLVSGATRPRPPLTSPAACRRSSDAVTARQ